MKNTSKTVKFIVIIILSAMMVTMLVDNYRLSQIKSPTEQIKSN